MFADDRSNIFGLPSWQWRLALGFVLAASSVVGLEIKGWLAWSERAGRTSALWPSAELT